MSEPILHTAYLALGTNLGDRQQNLLKVVQLLPPKVEVQAGSPVYITPPWGVLDQPAFLNQVLRVQTQLYPLELLAFLKDLEKRMGRVASVRYGPRLIDLDILFYDQLTLYLPELTLPHPQIPQRGFVLFPLADIAPDLRHPVSGLTIEQLLEQWLETNDPAGIRLFQA